MIYDELNFIYFAGLYYIYLDIDGLGWITGVVVGQIIYLLFL